MKPIAAAVLIVFYSFSTAHAQNEDIRQKNFLKQGLTPLQSPIAPVPKGFKNWTQFPISQEHFEILQLRAIYLLGKIKDPKAIPTLEKVADPQNHFPIKHQIASKEAIRKINSPGKPDLFWLVWEERFYGIPYTAQDLLLGLLEILSRDDEMLMLPTRLISTTATSAIQAIIFLVWGFPASLLSDGRLGPTGSEWTAQLINFIPWGLGALKLLPKAFETKSILEELPPKETSEDVLRRVIKDSHFDQTRNLTMYLRALPEDFFQDLYLLDTSDLWIDSGSGDAMAAEQYLNGDETPSVLPPGRARVIGISYKVERGDIPTFNGRLKLFSGRYLENIPPEEIGTNVADLITDFYGPFSYSWRIDLVLKQYMQFLKPSGKIFIFAANESSPLLTTTIETVTGKLSLIDWLQTLPGLRVELLEKEWLLPGDNMYTLKIEKVPGQKINIPELKLAEPAEGQPPHRKFMEIRPLETYSPKTMALESDVLTHFFEKFPTLISFREQLEKLQNWKAHILDEGETIFTARNENNLGHWSVRFKLNPGEKVPTIVLKLDRSVNCTTPEAIAEIEQALLLSREEMGLPNLKLEIKITKGKKEYKLQNIYDTIEFEIPSSPGSFRLFNLIMQGNNLSEGLRTRAGRDFVPFYQEIKEGRKSEALTLPIRPKRALRSYAQGLMDEFPQLKNYNQIFDHWLIRWRKVQSIQLNRTAWQASQKTRFGESLLQISQNPNGEFKMNVRFRQSPGILTEDVLAEMEEALLLTKQNLSNPNLKVMVRVNPLHPVDGYPTLVSDISFQIPVTPENMQWMDYLLNPKAMPPMVRRVRQRLATPFIDRTGIVTLPERIQLEALKPHLQGRRPRTNGYAGNPYENR